MFKYIRYKEAQNEFTKLSFVQKNEDVKVITFDKPIVAIEANSEDLIDELIAYQNEAINCEIITYDEFKALVKTTAQYARVIQLGNERLENNMNPIKSEYSESERETWAIQKEEALKWTETKNDEDAPYLNILATAEDDTIENFATAILKKNEAYMMMSANAISDKRNYKSKLLKELGIIR